MLLVLRGLQFGVCKAMLPDPCPTYAFVANCKYICVSCREIIETSIYSLLIKYAMDAILSVDITETSGPENKWWIIVNTLTHINNEITDKDYISAK